MSKSILSLALLVFITSPASALEIGDWVLARWQGGAYFFPGVVAAMKGNSITIRYDDGDVDTRPINQVRVYDWHVGSRVECNFNNAGDWYPGTINSMWGNTGLRIYYDDGDREDTTTASCRSH